MKSCFSLFVKQNHAVQHFSAVLWCLDSYLLNNLVPCRLVSEFAVCRKWPRLDGHAQSSLSSAQVLGRQSRGDGSWGKWIIVRKWLQQLVWFCCVLDGILDVVVVTTPPPSSAFMLPLTPPSPLCVSRCWCPAALCVAAVTRWFMTRRSWPAGRRTTPTWTRPARSAALPSSPSWTLRSATSDPSTGTDLNQICLNTLRLWSRCDTVHQIWYSVVHYMGEDICSHCSFPKDESQWWKVTKYIYSSTVHKYNFDVLYLSICILFYFFILLLPYIDLTAVVASYFADTN